MRSYLLLIFLLCQAFLCLAEEFNDPIESKTDNKTTIEAVRCSTNNDCKEFLIDSTISNKVICDEYIKICIIGQIDEQPNHGNDTTQPSTVTNETEFNSIPIVVWILFTIPFISIIILGIICGRRLKMQGENIQNNLLRTTIHGVHVEHLLAQRDLATIAISLPPPTYEKATGEIPPSYETFLQVLKEKRQSIIECDLAKNKRGQFKQHHCDNDQSTCSVCGSDRTNL
ncbi:hypothetical protein RDWZM_005489 [Blomia tropicalis]|uniref:Uncharacterized protein n=1 Tax=Blomia tropicalis TaxID=40697 RepID=A0A9Q0M8J1_BLOTA|nr:hypothetical protein BLOT_006067 [Blomia tropicalis]KAJ6219677.1 hypothetical protein RDWZM_005489 [Blomia tropicalis]